MTAARTATPTFDYALLRSIANQIHTLDSAHRHVDARHLEGFYIHQLHLYIAQRMASRPGALQFHCSMMALLSQSIQTLHVAGFHDIAHAQYCVYINTLEATAKMLFQLQRIQQAPNLFRTPQPQDNNAIIDSEREDMVTPPPGFERSQ